MPYQHLTHKIDCGVQLASPAGRLLRVKDIFVPRHNKSKGEMLPSRYRNHARKVVVFENGTLAPLSEIEKRYTLVSA